MSTLPTSGRVLVQTTVGDIEIELWARVCYKHHLTDSLLIFHTKETPLACRNFITLALEGERLFYSARLSSTDGC
jgi:peptidyl-prolyl cis-trans isomerase SDCCAG10